LILRDKIVDLAQASGLAADCGIAPAEDAESALGKLDNHLCELKELQIRDGLHIFGRAPEGRLQTDLLVALTRLPRNKGEGRDASLLRALALDLNLDDIFDPLNVHLAEAWRG